MIFERNKAGKHVGDETCLAGDSKYTSGVARKEYIKRLNILITCLFPHAFEKVWILGDIEGVSGIVASFILE